MIPYTLEYDEPAGGTTAAGRRNHPAKRGGSGLDIGIFQIYHENIKSMPPQSGKGERAEWKNVR